jgi:hypothetical protein
MDELIKSIQNVKAALLAHETDMLSAPYTPAEIAAKILEAETCMAKLDESIALLINLSDFKTP